MSRRRYSREELQHFFDTLGGCLEERAAIVLVGGCSVILGYGVGTTTVDIDTFSRSTEALDRAIAQACASTGMNPPIARAGTAQAPEGYEDRLVEHPTRGEFLTLLVLEKHDLAISKALRADERDRQHIAELHAGDALELATLVERFRDEMLPCYVGDEATIVEYFLWVVEELFGELARSRTERQLEQR